MANNKETKVCTKCKCAKKLTSFYTDKKRIRSICKSCDKKALSIWRINNRDKLRAHCRNWYKKNKCVRREYSIKTRFGITTKQYENMLHDQGYKCGICGKNQSLFKKRFSIDHNHETGKIRGLLCPQCNVALGLFKDNQEILISAAKYVTKHKVGDYE